MIELVSNVFVKKKGFFYLFDYITKILQLWYVNTVIVQSLVEVLLV